MNIYLENGNAVKTEWDDSITLSFIPTIGLAMPYDLTIEKYSEAAGDFINTTLNITPVLFANKYWVIKDSAGTIQTDHYFNNLEFKSEGEYRFIYNKSNTGVVSVRVFRGKESTEVVFDTTIDAQYKGENKVGFKYELNTSIPNSTSFEGVIEYRRGVVCIGDEVTLVLGAAEKARCFAAATTPLYTNTENQLRFYVKEKGGYKWLDDTSAATKEVSKANLVCDNILKKSNIFGIVKLETELAVEIQFADIPNITVRCGKVSNKSFTEDAAGLTLMFNTIQSWL